MITLLTILQNDFASHWECVTSQLQRILENFIQTQMLTVRVIEKEDTTEGSQSLSTSDSSDLLLDNNILRHVIVEAIQFASNHGDVLTATEGQRLYKALHTVGDLRSFKL